MQKFIILLFGSFLCAGCAYPGFKSTKSYSWSFDGSDALPVDVESSNGAITVVPTDEDEMEIEATVTTRGFTQEMADVALDKHIPTAVIDNGKVFVKSNGPSGFTNASVDFVLRVPEKTFAKLRTSNGSITVEGLSSDVDCHTSNGTVRAKGITGKLTVKTSNGSIKINDTVAEVSAKTSNGSITANFVPVGSGNELRTSNGRVHVGVPDGMRIALDVSTSNGTVTCELPLEPNAKKKKTSLLGTLAAEEGEAHATKVLVRTSNGSVQIREMELASDSDQVEGLEPNSETVGEIELPTQIEL